MSPGIKCFENPMKLREIKCQRILTSTKVIEEDSVGFELFVSKIPPDANEDELIPFFEKIGPLHTFRLMMKINQRFNRGHAYITYIEEQDAKDAILFLNNKEIRKGYCLSVTRSFNNCRIFIGGIPVNKTKDEVWHELEKQGVQNIIDVIMYRSYSNRIFNRGFVFVEFPSHKFAAKMRLKLRGLELFNCEMVVDWSVPQPLVTEEEMAAVKIVYLRNLDVTESRDELRAIIEKYIDSSDIQKIYKFKDYAFVHLSTRNEALKLLECLKDYYRNTFVEITLAKPSNFLTKPGFRKYQIMKNNPYLPKSYAESSNSTLGNTPSLLSNANFRQSSRFASTQDWVQSLSPSPVYSPTIFNPCNVYHWDENNNLEEERNSFFPINLPMRYHIQNGVGNSLPQKEFWDPNSYTPMDTYTSDNGSQSLVSAIKKILNEDDYRPGYSHMMNNLRIYCPVNYWKFQDVREIQHEYAHRRF